MTRRIFNPIAMRLGISGTQALTVAGRRTGKPRTVPVIPVVCDGATYLVSPRGETDWVRNLRAAGACKLGRQRRQRAMRATELPAGERPPVIGAYRRVAGRAVKSFFDRLPDPADHPVFRVEPL